MGPSEATRPPATATAPRRHPATPPPGTRLGPHYAHCFGCGDRHPTGLHLQLTVREGVRLTAEFEVNDDHQGAPGLAHGGVLASAFDEAMGALLWMLSSPGVTARLETDFLRPVPVGTTLYIDARCTGVDGRKVYTEADGRMDEPHGEVAVRAAGLFVVVGLDHFVRHGRGLDEVDLHIGPRYNP